MSTNRRSVDATPDQVWEVLADGWLYPLFVVGASRMRAVDDSWPGVGARLHHSVGTWPLLVDDTTEVLDLEEGARLRLRARAWPSGDAEVVISVDADGPTTSCVSLVEDAVSGPAVLVPPPLRHAQLHLRNTETLRRLALLVEGRASRGGRQG